MKVTTYKLPGSDEVYSMAGDADDRVPANAIDVQTTESAVPQVPPAETPSWGISIRDERLD